MVLAILLSVISSFDKGCFCPSIISCTSSYVNLWLECITVFPNQVSNISPLRFILKTTEKVNLSSLGLKEQRTLLNFSGSIGITRSTK